MEGSTAAKRQRQRYRYMLLYMRRYRKKNKKALAAYMRKYRKKNKRRKRTLEENALRRQKRAQNSTAASRRKEAAQSRGWRRKHRAQARAIFKVCRHKRRAAILSSGGSFTATEWLALKKKYGNHCLCCQKRKRLEPDHVKALSKGGSGKIGNIQPLCGTCNRRKGTKATDYRRRSYGS